MVGGEKKRRKCEKWWQGAEKMVLNCGERWKHNLATKWKKKNIEEGKKTYEKTQMIVHTFRSSLFSYDFLFKSLFLSFFLCVCLF